MTTTRSSVFIATSLDGYIARKDGGLDWLTGHESGTEDEGFGYQQFIDAVDALIMGRNTFEKVLTFEQWPYSKKVIVLTSRSIEIPDHLSDEVATASGHPQKIVSRLAKDGHTNFYIDGCNTIQRFLRAGRIDDMIITQIPVILGDGIPLFGKAEHDIYLKHIFTREFKNGYVQSKYKYEVISEYA